MVDTLFLCICEDRNIHGENGKWQQFPLGYVGSDTQVNGQQSHELSPMNG